MLDARASRTHRNSKDATALSVAARHGYDDVARSFIRAGANPLECDARTQGNSLMLAARFGHPKVVKVLMEAILNDDDIEKGDCTDYTALMRAAGQGHAQVTIELLRRRGDRTDIGKGDKDGVTALMYAARNGYANTAMLLLRKCTCGQVQAILDAVDNAGETALYKAAEFGHLEALRGLLPWEPSIDLPIEVNGMTPLMVASENGHYGAVRLLLGAKADINRQRTDDKRTALMLAVCNNWEITARVLLQSPQADIYRQAESGEKTEKGDTALILALRGGKLMENVAALLTDYRTVILQSMQHTSLVSDHVHTWLAGRLPESVKASLPPFNRRAAGDKLQLRGATATTEVLNVPVFGCKIPAAIIALFKSGEIRELAGELGVTIPQFTLQPFVQGRMSKVKDMIGVARARNDCQTPPNSTAVDKLE
eukprot:6428063-Prymnesium_polylepis.2